jgi:hypothetical protein
VVGSALMLMADAGAAATEKAIVVTLAMMSTSQRDIFLNIWLASKYLRQVRSSLEDW